MLFAWSTGVSGFGLPGTAEHSGKTNRVRFSYRANKRRVFEGAGLDTLDLEAAEV